MTRSLLPLPLRRALPFLAALIPLGVSLVLSIIILSNSGRASGFDGYYYALQTRAVMQSGRLLMPDQPAFFYLAALAGFVTGDPLSGVMMAKVLVQGAVTAALFFVVRGVSGKTIPALWASLVWAVSFSGLYFAFELAKNNLGNLVVLLFFISALKIKKPLPLMAAGAVLFAAALASHIVSAGLIAIAGAYFAARYVRRAFPSRRTRIILLGAGALGAAAIIVLLFVFRFADVAFFMREFSPLEGLRQYEMIINSTRPPAIRWEQFIFALVCLPLAALVLVFFRKSRAVVRGAALILFCLSVPLLRFSWDATAYRFLLETPLFALIVIAGIVPFRFAIVRSNNKTIGRTVWSLAPLLAGLILLFFLPEKLSRLKLNYQPNYTALSVLVEPVKLRVPPGKILIAHKGLSSMLWYETGLRATHFKPVRDVDRYYRVANGFGPVHFEEYRLTGGEKPLALSPSYTLLDEPLWQRFYESRQGDIVFLGSWLNPCEPPSAHVGWLDASSDD